MMRQYKQSLWADPLVLAALATGIALALFQLGAAPLWFDETFSASWVRQPWLDMLHTVVTDNHLPLYPILLKLWSAAVGDSAWSLRALNLVFAAATIYGCAALAARLAGPVAARWAAWLVALSPFLLHHAQEARMYPLVSTLATLSLLLLVEFMITGKRLGGAWIAVSLLLLLSHYYTLFFIGAELLVLTLLWRSPLRGWLPAAAIVALATLALVGFALLVPSLNSGESYRTGLLALPGVGWSLLSGYVYLPSAEQLHADGVAAVKPYLRYTLLYALPVVLLGLCGLRYASAQARLLLLVTLSCVLLGPFAAHWLLPSLSVNPRYFVCAIPALMTLLAIGAAGLRAQTSASTGKARTAVMAWAPPLAGTALLALLLVADATHLSAPGQKRADVNAAAAWLDTRLTSDTPLLVSSNEMHLLTSFHWPQRPQQLYPEAGVVANATNAAAIATALPFADGAEQVVVVLGRAWLSDPEGALTQALTLRYPSCGRADLRGIRILCLRKI